ncbi:MAG: hypothetical protein KDA77_03875 [Planctomycetaceae bacterium]|nr:hypothetical protein [Planctomycetaceae bacterium]
MIEFMQACFEWPTLPATVLVAICLLYWLSIILGVMDLDLLDFDLDFEVPAEGPSFLDFGFIGLRFLNLGDVPVMLWMSIFSLSMWMLSINFDSKIEINTFMDYLPLAARNIGISLVVTKLLTQPLKGLFKYSPPNEVDELLGKTCRVTSTSVTDRFGQAEMEAEGAPLKLHIRSEGETIRKGDLVRLTDFNTEQQVFFVVKINQES